MPAPAISCSPQDLVAAARCFRCIPPGLEASIITSLLCEWANNLPPRFSPASIPGLMLWLDATPGHGVSELAGNVTSWLDQSPNATMFNPAGAGAAIYDPVGLNGNPAVYFSAGSLLSALNNGPACPLTIFAVVRTDSTVGDANPMGIIGSNAIASLFYCFGPASVAGQAINWYNGTGDTRTDSAATYIDGIAFLMESVIAGTDGDAVSIPLLFTNGTNFPTTLLQTPNGIGLDGGGMVLGSSDTAGDTFAFHGWIAEIIVYNSALSAPNRVLVEQYLDAKWTLGF